MSHLMFYDMWRVLYDLLCVCTSWGLSTAPMLWIWTVSPYGWSPSLTGSLLVSFQMSWLLSYRRLHLKPLRCHFIIITFLLWQVWRVSTEYRSLVICSGKQFVCFWMHGFILSLKCFVASSFLNFFWSGKRVLLFVVLLVVLELYSLLDLGWKWTACKIWSLSLGDKTGNCPSTGLCSLIWDCYSAQFVWKSCWMG